MSAFNPVLFDFPDHIETERLLLRAPGPGDGAVVFASVEETLADLRAHPASMPWAMAEQSVATVEEYCRRGAAEWLLRTGLPYLAFERGSGAHVAYCSLHRFSWEARVFEIGWWCRKRYQGQGYATEAVRALTQFAFSQLGAHRVWCVADEANAKSWRVAERVGFAYEGTLKSERADPDGTRRDMRVYAIAR